MLLTVALVVFALVTSKFGVLIASIASVAIIVLGFVAIYVSTKKNE